MTIRAGINPEAVLWKYTETYKRQEYNRQEGKYEMVDRTDYYVIRLHTRRARTQGYTVKKEVTPFFESIRIKLTPVRVWRNNGEEIWYTAVGTRSDRIRTKEEWDAIEIDEAAQKWYNRIKNQNIVPLLDKRMDKFSDDILEEMRQAAQDDESDVESWPPEPNLREYQLQLPSHTHYYHPITWR